MQISWSARSGSVLCLLTYSRREVRQLWRKRQRRGQKRSNVSIIANYAYDLVKEYNQFYHDFSILREENEALKVFRLALSANVGKIVKTAMGLLGIEVPERM